MPLFGAHLSIAGGLHKAIEAALALECQTVQLFTKNASQWVGKALLQADIELFRQALKSSSLRFPTAHDSYLINLASPDEVLYRKSIAAFVDEIERAEALGLSYLVTHPGAHMGSGDDVGLKRVVAALDEALSRCSGYAVTVLIETTAGQGTSLGHRFEHLAAILNGVSRPERIGVCFDTCHVFAAGYALRTTEEYAETFGQFDAIVGLKKLAAFHLNDSVKPLGSRVDRHAGLGLGHIGLAAFERLVHDVRFHPIPMILETPKEADDKSPMDPVNLGILRGFRDKAAKDIRKKARP